MTPTTKAAVVEALKIAVLQNEHDMLMTGDELRQCEAAIALLGSEPPLPIKGITRDDTVHGEEYFTRAMVESMLWAPEPETTVTERDPHSNAFMQVPKGTEITAHWPSLAEPVSRDGWKDHDTAKLVNELRDIAVKYAGAEQLRERIAQVIRPLALAASPTQPRPQPLTEQTKGEAP